MTKDTIRSDVSIVKTDEKYPDFPYDQKSNLHDALLDLLEGLNLPRENPFSTYIKPGQVALIKPNWVKDQNPLGYDIESLITHSSIIKMSIDLLAIAMQGKGRIIIADAPLQNCDFDNLKRQARIEEIVRNSNKKFPELKISVEDWRLTVMKSNNVQQNLFEKKSNPGDRYKIVDLGKESFLEDISKYADRFRVTKYKPSLMKKHHCVGKHEYLVTKRVFEADFILNLPKIKTHVKAGLTGALKNLVGINGHKEFLPHHTKGSPANGGDNYSHLSWLKSKYEDLYDYVWENIGTFSVFKRKLLLRFLRLLEILSKFLGGDGIYAGSWAGNDTVWRTILDLNRIVYFGETSCKILNIADGIVAGEKQGPLEPSPKPLGILVAGENPAYVDAVIAKIMGYSINKIPTVYNAIYHKKSKFSTKALEDFTLNFSEKEILKRINFDQIPNFCFKKPLYWESA